MQATKMCPACHSSRISFLADFPIRDFDGMIFNTVTEIWNCASCGFSRMESALTDTDIADHYAQDSIYSVLAGVGVGGNSQPDAHRYEYFYNIIRENGLNSGSIADIGCSRGGFLKYMANADQNLDLAGVDLDYQSLSQLQHPAVKKYHGSAFELPFEDESLDLLTYFDVLEHILDVDAIVAEAARTLKSDGHVLIEVPDAAKYHTPENRIGAHFWLAIKEHVNHFTPGSLEKIFSRCGFNISSVHRTTLPMKSGFPFPSLIIVASKADSYRAPLQDSHAIYAMKSYVEKESISMQEELNNLTAFMNKYKKICFWGIGLEFFNLVAHGVMERCYANVKLFDANDKKHGMKIDGRIVQAPPLSPSGGLVCCSFMSNTAIRNAAMKIGWARDDIYMIEK